MINIEVHGYCLKSNRPEAQTRKLIDLVLCKNLPKYHVHRDNQRTLSVQFEINEEKLVLKIPRARNTRVWERVLSVFRGSDTARVFQGMLKLEEIGFLGARPILMAQRIVAGMTVDSFLIYEYLDGRPCTEADSK